MSVAEEKSIVLPLFPIANEFRAKIYATEKDGAFQAEIQIPEIGNLAEYLVNNKGFLLKYATEPF